MLEYKRILVIGFRSPDTRPRSRPEYYVARGQREGMIDNA